MKISNFLYQMTAIIAIAFSSWAHASEQVEIDENDVILAGHDAVAYFTEKKPVLGLAKYTSVHNGAIYRFSSAKNRDKFAKNPEKYAPQYGGFCAYGMTFGKKFEVDGKAFQVVDGKLYVNKNRSVYSTWKKDIPKHISEANSEWHTVEQLAAKN